MDWDGQFVDSSLNKLSYCSYCKAAEFTEVSKIPAGRLELIPVTSAPDIASCMTEYVS
jgi:hypothetical protein